PLFAHDATSPHNRVAYGSLIASDGIRSTTVPQSRILVIDDETRDFGAEFLLDRNGNPISPDDTAALLDKMGDGTMLISTGLMQNLITEDEIERISAAEFDKAGISDDITQLDDIDAVDAAQQTIDKRVQRLVHSTVTQFRAATPDLPGMAKGTMTTSRWADRLGVDAIISTNDIKGDDGRLSSPGFKAVSRFWVNRKSDARYGLQSVGPQVKGTIPDATRVEFNPRMKKQAEQLAEIAAQPSRLMGLYIQQRERRVASTELDELQSAPKPDWLYEVGKADEKGLLTGFSKMNRKLDRFLRGRRVDVATHGIEVPSAMAQHHSQLKPWEVCNKSLPDGAVVAYYRSPFPNVGAAAIGINTHRAIKDADSEAFHKEGVAYLNPWTAKNIAITDFDRDTNGYFVGYLPNEPGFADQVRAQLAHTESYPPAAQYEAGRSLIAGLIYEAQHSPETAVLRAATETEGFPVAVAEFVERNAPEHRPPEVKKAKKIKHPWHEEESQATATWRAWAVTANNPTGKVANAGMTLQSLAAETQCAPDREDLLRQIATSYQGVLIRERQGKLMIPTDEQLQAKGFSAYQ
ncbi:MAG: hypothetical protein AAFZ49_16430, partial [Cyanobacteria bacterium J06659_2]